MTNPTPLLEFFKRGEVARDVRLAAAQGVLAPRAFEQVSLLVLLTGDPDAEINRTAEGTLKQIPTPALEAFLARSDVPAALREFFAARGVQPAATPPNASAEDQDLPLVVSDEGQATQNEEDADKTIVQRVAEMSFTERLKAAMNGTREMRAILIRDTNKMISSAVLSSPKLTEPEVESFAKMANVAEECLRTIGHNRGWLKNYAIVLALVKNAKTPVAVSMNLLQRLNTRDLTMVSVDRNVPDPLRVAARRKVSDNAGGRR